MPSQDTEHVSDAPQAAKELPYRELFDHAPSGLLVTDHEGRVEIANLTATRMLGEALQRPDVTCCVLLGCGRPGTALADGCISRLAAAAESPVPEVRVDLPNPTSEMASAWVIGARADEAGGRVLLQLRPGVVGDRRRRTEPHWISGPRLRIYTLGRTRVESGEGAIAGEWLGHRPGEVLKYLVCNRGRIVPLEELIEHFWPAMQGRAAGNVRQAIHTLRERLEPGRRRHDASLFVLARKGGYELNTANVWIDADVFEDQVRRGLRWLDEGDVPAAENALRTALELHHGEFMSDEPYAEWALSERDRLRELATQGLRALACVRLEAGDLPGAHDHMSRLAELEPYDVEIQRELLTLLLRRGRHSEAARRLDIVRQRYRRTFDEDPQIDLADLSRDASFPAPRSTQA